MARSSQQERKLQHSEFAFPLASISVKLVDKIRLCASYYCTIISLASTYLILYYELSIVQLKHINNIHARPLSIDNIVHAIVTLAGVASTRVIPRNKRKIPVTTTFKLSDCNGESELRTTNICLCETNLTCRLSMS